jgi:cyclase
MSKGDFTDSRHFVIQPLAEGVQAAIAREGGWAICNSGIIDLGGMSLVFDTFVSPTAAGDLLQAARHHLGHSPELVINSHYHNDHTWGNQVFPQRTPIVACEKTYQLMRTEGKKELEEERSSAEKSLAHFKEKLHNAGTEDERREARLFLGQCEAEVHDLPHLSVRLPEITFQSNLLLRGSRRSAELIAYRNGHTGSDAILFLPDDKLVFMGDILFVGMHPYLGGSAPTQLIRILKEIMGFKAERFVPGHGQVGTQQDLELLIGYVEECVRTARALIEAGTTERETLDALPVPERFRSWGLASLYPANLRAIGKRLSKG